MGLHNGSFPPGNTFGKGRPPGVRNRASYALRERLKARGDKDPAEFLSEIVSNEKEPKELRVAASGQLMPYFYNKLAPVTPLLFIEEPISIPRPTTIKQAYGNIAYISELKAQGQIDKDWGDSLINDNRVILNGLIDEAKLIAQGDTTREQSIRIEGGLPALPGTNIVMPKINGNEVAAISHITPPEPPDPADYNADPRPEATPYNDGLAPTNEEPQQCKFCALMVV